MSGACEIRKEGLSSLEGLLTDAMALGLREAGPNVRQSAVHATGSRAQMLCWGATWDGALFLGELTLSLFK